MGCRKCVVFSLILFGSAFIIAGIIVAVLGSFNDLAKDEIKKGLPLKSGSTSYERWEEPEGEFYIEYYVFNITNSDDLDQGKAQLPQVEQIGPYTYRTVAITNVQERKGQTIKYRPRTVYYFDQSRSCENCNDVTDQFITINYPLLVFIRGASQQIKGSQLAATGIKFNLAQFKIGIFQTRSVNEILWGYKDQAFHQFTNIISNSTNPNMRTFALQFNDSDSDVARIHTGENHVDRVTEYIEWNGGKTLPWWNSVSANKINGTDGSRFKPFIEKDDKLYVLVTEVCRSLQVSYEKTVSLHGIDLYRFTLLKESLTSGDINPKNKGFCVTGIHKKCLPSGLLDVNVCKGGLLAPPFVASSPYFYLGENNLANNVGLKPAQKERHATYVDIEPNTGLAMRGHKRLQVNMMMASFSIVELLLNKNFSQYIPIFFTDKSSQISEKDADDFKIEVLLPLKVLRILPYLMIGFGLLLLLIAIIITVLRCCKLRKQTKNRKDVAMSSYTNDEKFHLDNI